MERFAVLLAESLIAREWRASIYCTQRGGPFVEQARDKGIPVTITPFTSRWNNLWPTALMDVLRRDGVSIVHSQNGNWLAAAVASRVLRVPIIHTEHGLEGEREPWKLVVQKRIARGLTDRTIAVSESLQDQLCAQLGIKRGDIQVIRNGIDTHSFDRNAETRQAVRKALEVDDDTVLIGAVARLHHLKGIDVLAEAASLLPKGLKAEVVVAGDGQDRAMIESILSRSAVRFRLLGMRSDVPRLLHGFDVLVMPSRSEALPLALLEAMACALPAIVTDVGEMPAIVEGGAGVVVPRENASALAKEIAALACSARERERLGTCAARVVRERFGVEAMVNQYIAAYGQLVG